MEQGKLYELKQLNNQYHVIFGLIDGLTEKLSDGIATNPTPTYINNASGTVQVLDPKGVPVVIGPAGAITTPAVYMAGTNGNYTFLITSVFNPPLGPGYTILVDLTAPGGFVGHAPLRAVVVSGKLGG